MKLVILSFFLFLVYPVVAQTTVPKGYRKHLLYFTDKNVSPYSISNPDLFLSERAQERRKKQHIQIKSRDLPVNPAYVTGLKNQGAQVLYTSKWFNGAVVFTDSVLLAKILQLPYIKSGQTLNRRSNIPNAATPTKPINFNQPALRVTAERKNYGLAFNQAQMIGATQMHDAGFRGENMHVAVFDGGFPGVDQVPAFAPLFNENRIKATFDFVDKDNFVFEKDNHGTNTLSTMAAYLPGTFIGTAPKANYYLFITEDSRSEHNIEEINWLLAAEFADSAGVDVINSSLGYYDFDFPSVDYSYRDMNGRTAIVTRAADYAAATGMLIVNSAGNEGNKPWQYIAAPADGDSVLAVGAVDSLGSRISFSSIGPTSDGRIKPNLMAQGFLAAVLARNGAVVRANGTSFAGPILCGMATGFWQANPTLSNMEVLNLLQRSASLAKNPNNSLGYGIPNFTLAQELAKEEAEKILLYPNPIENGQLKIKMGPEYLNQSITVTIYNMIAQKLVKQSYQINQLNPFLTIDISGLKAGAYHCQIAGATNDQTLKFIKL